MTQREHLKNPLDSIRRRLNEFEKEINLILATIDYIEKELNDRVRNEDGESAFPLERPKTCVPILNESTKQIVANDHSRLDILSQEKEIKNIWKSALVTNIEEIPQKIEFTTCK